MNLLSMTGFASAEQNTDRYTLTLTLRSVNHRFLDASLRLPEELKSLEPALRERIVSRMRRGKLDCQFQLVKNASAGVAPGAIPIDENRVKALIVAQDAIQRLALDANSLSCEEMLRFPGVIAAAADLDSGELAQTALELFDRAWTEFAASRAREGEKLGAVLGECCDGMERLVAGIEPVIPKVLAAYRDKLYARLRDAALDPDENRLKQELALFATKIEVSEELDRLKTHIAETRRVLRGEPPELAKKNASPAGSNGKRLDFLAQELHREANTLGSKSVDAGISKAAMELKVLIEQIREQVQNIE